MTEIILDRVAFKYNRGVKKSKNTKNMYENELYFAFLYRHNLFIDKLVDKEMVTV